jgi:hypothetical protein
MLRCKSWKYAGAFNSLLPYQLNIRHQQGPQLSGFPAAFPKDVYQKMEKVQM